MKIIVVGATGTIGTAVSNLLKEKGHQVFAVSRHSSPSVDITDENSVEQLLSQVGTVDAVVCAAGDAAFKSLDQMEDTDLQLSTNSKLLGQIKFFLKALPYLYPNGVIVLTGGILAYQPMPSTSAIAMVNGALESFAKAAALELHDGKRVVVVHPDWVAETAAQLGMPTNGLPTAKDTAQAYWNAINSQINGQPVFVPGHGPKNR